MEKLGLVNINYLNIRTMEKINRRVTYSYWDNQKGLLEGFIDMDLNYESREYELSDSQLKKYVIQKWKRIKYKGGDFNSIKLLHIE